MGAGALARVLADKQTGRQADKRASRQADKRTSGQAGRPRDKRHAGRLTGGQETCPERPAPSVRLATARPEARDSNGASKPGRVRAQARNYQQGAREKAKPTKLAKLTKPLGRLVCAAGWGPRCGGCAPPIINEQKTLALE